MKGVLESTAIEDITVTYLRHLLITEHRCMRMISHRQFILIHGTA
jgi:hypothetical protein